MCIVWSLVYTADCSRNNSGGIASLTGTQLLTATVVGLTGGVGMGYQWGHFGWTLDLLGMPYKASNAGKNGTGFLVLSTGVTYSF